MLSPCLIWSISPSHPSHLSFLWTKLLSNVASFLIGQLLYLLKCPWWAASEKLFRSPSTHVCQILPFWYSQRIATDCWGRIYLWKSHTNFISAELSSCFMGASNFLTLKAASAVSWLNRATYACIWIVLWMLLFLNHLDIFPLSNF